jgi:membrane protein implicated in regulation of membrane protease activity
LQQGGAMEEMIFYWLLIALLFFMVEMGQPGLFLFLSFSIGACGGALSSWFGYSLILQSVVALVTSFTAFIGCYYWLRMRGYLGKHEEKNLHYHSNIYALIGRKGLVITTITPDTLGQVKVSNGEYWSAKPLHNTIITSGTHVEVIRVSGAHIVVKEINS